MDLIHRKEKYKEYLQRLEQARKSINQSVALRGIHNTTDKILDELRDKKSLNEYNWILLLLVIPLLFFMAVSIIKIGLGWRIIPLICIFLSLLYYRWKILQVTRFATKGKLPAGETQAKESEWLKAKIHYILLGIDVKRTRINLLRWIYFLFCPLLIYFLVELLKGAPSNNLLPWFLLAAYLIAGFFWIYYFKSDIEDLDFTQEEMEEYLLQL